MDDVLTDFDDLVRNVIDGTATGEERRRMVALMWRSPHLQKWYCDQMRVHSLLVCRSGRVRTENGEILKHVNTKVRQSGKTGSEKQKTVVSGARGSRYRWWKAAAAATILLSGAAMWYAADISNTCDRLGDEVTEHAATVVPPVKLVSQKGIRGLDIPETLPGTMRLESGEVIVRLQTGVELTLIGPASMTVESGIRVKLDKGGLLANVPHWATGFTVRTRELEIYDLGTMFGVQVDEGVSDVFVFKGSVQVNEAGYSEWGREVSGAGVGICEAGEGVRAVSGESPSKNAADWADGEKLFGTVKGERAFRDPAKTLATATRIADLWAERYMPGSRLVAKKMRVGNGIPFQKTAWVRASVPQQEVTNMNRASAAAVLTAAAAMMGAGTAGAFSEPVLVQTSPVINRHWSTVFTNEVPLKWNWSTAATRAELEINGMNGSFITNFTSVTSNYVWKACTGSVPAVEDVYDLQLRFYDANNVAVGVLTSRLSVVKGAFGETVVDPGPSDRRWTMVRENVAIPYDASWAAATDGATASRLVIAKTVGVTQTNSLADASGYFGWKLKNSGWGYGTFNLALTFPSAEGKWDATLAYVPCGTLVLMR